MITVYLEFVKKCDSGKEMQGPTCNALGFFILIFLFLILLTFMYVFSGFLAVIFSWAVFMINKYDKDTII